jgi:hypothetical protein
MRWARYVTGMREIINAYKIVVGKTWNETGTKSLVRR